MDEFREFATKITSNLSVAQKTRQRIHDEIVEHLCEEASLCSEAGMSDDEAARESVARFGSDEVLAGLIAESMPRESRRYQLLQQAWSMSGVTVGIWFALAVGAWFSFFDDSVSGVGILPRSIWLAVYAGSTLLVLVSLVMLAGLLFREGVQRSIVGGLFVVLAFAAAMFVMDRSGIDALFHIHEDQNMRVTATQQFFMRLYLCWCPTLLIGIGLLIADRSRKVVSTLRLISEIGFLSAILWGGRLLTSTSPWLILFKWPKLLSTALLAVVFVLLVGLTARVLARRMATPDGHFEVAEV